MKARMASYNSKKAERCVFRASLTAVLVSAGLIAPSAPVAYAATAAAPSTEMVDRINKAIKEAEKKLGSNPVVEEVRKDIQTNLVPGRTGQRAAAPAQSRSMSRPVEPVRETLSASPDPDPAPLKFKSDKQQAEHLAWKASGTYARRRDDYSEAHELAQEALKIDPQNRKARYVQHIIDRDIKERPMDIGGTDRTIALPEGRIALTVALSDGRLTLPEAEEIAVKNSLMLESLRHRASGARRKVNEAIRAFFPTAGLEFSGGGGVINDDAYHSKKAMLNFSQPVYYGGELIFTLRQAQASMRSEELKYQKERTDVVRQTGEAYRNAVNAVYNLNYQEELYAEIQKYKVRQDKAYEARLVAEIEKLEIASIFNQVAFQRETAITTQKSANLTLCQAIGVKADQVLPVDPTVQVNRMNEVDLDDYLNRVGMGNYDIRIKQATLESAYYGAKVFDAQRQPRVDLRGNWGWAGEAKNVKLPDDQQAGDQGPFTLDTEHEQAIIATVSVPWGPNTTNYSYQRRFFAPTVSSFQGSEDFKHSVTTNFFDRLSNLTDEEVAKADYLKAMAELQKERTDQEINARQAYYDYESALLQLETSEAKIIFRERQVKILEQTTRMEEARVTELLNELTGLAEDRYSRITAISSANNALAKMDYLAGMEGINTNHEIQSPQK